MMRVFRYLSVGLGILFLLAIISVFVIPREKLALMFSDSMSGGVSFFNPFRIFSGSNSSQNSLRPSLVTTTQGEKYPASLPQPQASIPLTINSIPAGVTEIDISEKGFNPKKITVREGGQVVLVLKNVGTKTHSFAFTDSLFSPVTISVAPHEMRGIQFYALRKGTFTFRCDLPGHEDNGEVGEVVIE